MRHLFTAVVAISALTLVATATPAQAKTKKTTTTTTTTTTDTTAVATPDANTRTDVDQPEVPPMSANEGSAFKVGFDGFADIQGKVTNHRDVSDRGFSLNDAALMMRANYKYAEAVVDLPFYTTSTASESGDDAGSPHSNAFNFASGQAQAYLNFHNFSSAPVFVRAGQYDSFFGLEANDSRDRFFADKGVIKQMLPWTSMGVLGGWSMNGLTLQAQVANGPSLATSPLDGQWTSSGGSMSNAAPSYALNAKYERNGKMASAAIMFDHDSGPVAGSPDGFLADVMVGCKEGKFSTGLEFVDRKDPGVAVVADPKQQGHFQNSWGVAALGAYHITNTLSAGVRMEYAHDPVFSTLGAGGVGLQLGDVVQGSIGPVWQLEKNLALRGDVTAGHISSGRDGVDGQMNFGLSVSAVATLF